ncbi:MAG: c-type cytochrome [Bacteroidales bacterium]|nr:c-type cytochrome [Bacteroidales bacterium]
MSNTDEKNIHHGEPEIDELTKNRFLGGHEYDGIRELDNKLPSWWVWLFIITVVFSAVYLLGYQVAGWWPSQKAEYEKEMAQLAEMKKSAPQNNVDVATMLPLADAASLDAGKETFKKICSTCHGMNGQGLVGPDMTDEYWIHGDSLNNKVTIQDLYKVVITGVLEKGMISYKDQLSPVQIQQVLSYIISLQGTKPAGAKAPQGRKYDKFG